MKVTTKLEQQLGCCNVIASAHTAQEFRTFCRVENFYELTTNEKRSL
jgi:hypothetical protein